MRGTKPKGPVLDHFVVVDPGNNALTSRIKCKYCPWEHLGHPAKMQAHLDRCCPAYGERAQHPFTSSEQSRAVNMLALACVKTATPNHVLERERERGGEFSDLLRFPSQIFRLMIFSLSARQFSVERKIAPANMFLYAQMLKPAKREKTHQPGAGAGKHKAVQARHSSKAGIQKAKDERHLSQRREGCLQLLALRPRSNPP